MPDITKQPVELALVIPKGMIDLSTPAQLLLEQLTAIKQNPTEQIPIAHAQCQIVGRLIDISKTQIQQGNMIIDMMRFKQANEA